MRDHPSFKTTFFNFVSGLHRGSTVVEQGVVWSRKATKLILAVNNGFQRDVQPRSPCFFIMVGVDVIKNILHVLPQKYMKYIPLEMHLLYYEKSVTSALC